MKIKNFFDNIKGKTIAFCGIGRSNLPVMELFHKKGAKIVARDKNTNFNEQTMAILNSVDAKLILGEQYLDDLCEDMVLRTPGIPFTLPQFQEAINRGVNVSSEMEIFLELCPCKVYAITGSDGKTTTTSLIAEILKVDGNKVHLGGNIGKPLLPVIEEIDKDDVAVVELSSFQLMSIKQSVDVSVVTNLSPNHLDIHKDMEEYIDAKKNVFKYQAKNSKTVLNLDNEITSSFENEINGNLMFFSRKSEVQNGAYEKDNIIYVNQKPILDATKMKLQGGHNIENMMCAICAVWGDVKEESIVNVAVNFGGVAHRAELVRELDGVKYYNDSIASSPTRVIKGTLSMYDRKIILIVGGADKGVAFDELGDAICQRAKTLIIVKPEKRIEGFKNSAGDSINDAVLNSKYYDLYKVNIIRVTNMEDAVKKAREISESGDLISLSPACTSFDMYKDFEVRGNHYKELVMKL